MGRFKKHLVSKMEGEDAAKKKQETLKKESRISDDGQELYVREKGILDYAKSILFGTVYILFIGLVFIGLVTLINPMSRGILLNMLFGILGGA